MDIKWRFHVYYWKKYLPFTLDMVPFLVSITIYSSYLKKKEHSGTEIKETWNENFNLIQKLSSAVLSDYFDSCDYCMYFQEYRVNFMKSLNSLYYVCGRNQETEKFNFCTC
jgi:hypothetical protein